MKGNNTFDCGSAQTITQYEADPAEEQLLHFVNADPTRTPSFTAFPKPDYFFSIGHDDSAALCPSTTTADTRRRAA